MTAIYMYTQPSRGVTLQQAARILETQHKLQKLALPPNPGNHSLVWRNGIHVKGSQVDMFPSSMPVLMTTFPLPV